MNAKHIFCLFKIYFKKSCEKILYNSGIHFNRKNLICVFDCASEILAAKQTSKNVHLFFLII